MTDIYKVEITDKNKLEKSREMNWKRDKNKSEIGWVVSQVVNP